MISEFFLGIADSIATWLLTLIPTVPDTIFTNVTSTITGFAMYVASMSVWVNWQAMGLQITVILGLYFTLMLLKVMLRLFAFVPVVGGAG